MGLFTWMQSFNAVAELGSFKQAAERLGVSPQLISKYVAQLEQHLGAQLLHRTTRRLHLTQTGAAYFERSRYLLQEFEALEESVRQSATQLKGKLKINAPMSFGFRHLAQAVAAFEQRHPEVTIELVLNDREVDLIEEGFDLALRIATLKDSSLIARKLTPIRLLVCGSAAYFSRYGRPQTPDELTQHHCLRYSVGSLQHYWRFEKAGQSYQIDVNSRFSANNGDALKEAAIAGAGLILQPTFIVAEAIAAGQLEPVLCDYQTSELHLYAVYPSRQHLSARVRYFIDFLADYFAPEPYWDQLLQPR